jgi:hypothetical protein
MEEKNTKNERFVSIMIIIFLIIILTFRVVSQGKKANQSLKNLREGKNNKLSFSYPSDWKEMENEDILDVFNPISEEKYSQNSFDLNTEDLEKLEQITLDNEDSDINSEILFLAMKSKIPQFSLGVISVQKLDLKENNIGNLEKIMEDKFEREINNSYSKITKKEKGGYFISLEVVTYINERPTFKSKNLGLLNEEDIFLITLNSANENWNDFKNEFNMIISSIQFDKND